MIEIVCSVRGCGVPLERGTRIWLCANGHSFDLGKSGYCNLLQPNERRSKNPGDSKSIVQARRRLFERGLGDYLADAIETILKEASARGPVLDVGCGEGFHLHRLTSELGAEGLGVDISTPAVDLAARTYPELTWVVGNADRTLPITDQTVRIVIAITARVNTEEFARLVSPGGLVLIATPGDDDLAEIRELVLGQATKLDSLPNIATEPVRYFEVAAHEQVRTVIDADREMIGDLLIATYRGQRDSQKHEAAEITSLQITQSREIVLLRRV